MRLLNSSEGHLETAAGHRAFFSFPSAYVKLISLAAKTSVPIRYMIWPPDVPEWESLTVEDQNGVRRPKLLEKENELVSGSGMWWLFTLSLELAVLYGSF